MSQRTRALAWLGILNLAAACWGQIASPGLDSRTQPPSRQVRQLPDGRKIITLQPPASLPAVPAPSPARIEVPSDSSLGVPGARVPVPTAPAATRPTGEPGSPLLTPAPATNPAPATGVRAGIPLRQTLRQPRGPEPAFTTPGGAPIGTPPVAIAPSLAPSPVLMASASPPPGGETPSPGISPGGGSTTGTARPRGTLPTAPSNPQDLGTGWEAPVPGAPAAPSNVVAADSGGGRALVGWTDRSTDEASFEVERQPAFSGGSPSVGAGITAYVDHCGPGTFLYRVRAVNATGVSNWSGWATALVTAVLPEGPSDLRVVDNLDELNVRLQWLDNSANEGVFVIERQTWVSGAWSDSTVLTAPANATMVLDGAGSGTHRYRVAARNQAGDSAPTPWVGVTVLGNWTTFTPSPDTRQVYVSSSQGHDSNPGSEEAPKRTLAAGYAQLRDGKPDWLLLRAGDTWDEVFPAWNKSGRSATEPMVVKAYGAGVRPRVRTGNATGLRPAYGVHNHLAFTDFHLVAHTWSGTPNATLPPPAGIDWISGGEDLLFENLLIEKYANNLMLQGLEDNQLSNVRLRRCVLADPLLKTVGNTNFYCQYVTGLTLEENYFLNAKANDSLTNPAGGTKLSHNVYISEFCGEGSSTLIGNVAYNARSNFTVRTGGVVRNNLSIRGGQGIIMGYTTYQTLLHATCAGNVVTESRDHWNGQGLGIGLVFDGVGLGSDCSNNLVCHGSDGTYHNAMWINQGTYAANGGVHDLSVHQNVFHDWSSGPNEQALIFVGGTPPGPIWLGFNDLQQTNGKALVFHAGANGQPGNPETAHVTYYFNRYFTTAANGFLIQNPAPTALGFPGWHDTYEPTSEHVQAAYPDSARTIQSYNDTLGGIPDTEHWIAEARQQSRWYWRPQFTARAANSYMRQGFGMPDE
ncbi:MAG TPA: hypothetical protein VD963_06010 [Phycisphaerales bacterium]|nr:hypothetical protein [Phycisphaerales bacterium]